MTRNDIKLFAPAYKNLSIIIRVSQERAPRNLEWLVFNHCEVIESVIGLFNALSIENGLGAYEGADDKAYTGNYEDYMMEARKALGAFIVCCEEYRESTRYLVDILAQRTSALSKLFA